MKPIIKLTLVLLLAFTASCYYDSEERLYPKLSDPCKDKDVTFSGTVTQILQPCLSCHSNSAVSGGEGGGIKLENYADVVAVIQSGRLMGGIKHESGYIPMPQGGGILPECQISQLQKWIDNQTPNN
ncbi:MAG TPA: hypothetical protein DCL77_18200 [Prolixibacteraceae bacterium]|jgi:hypothetical protein|nr:hypothetical protein [Prolixibacteraceae bacterium]